MVISLADRERPADRPPKPELQLNLLGTLAATSLALLAYLVALLAHLSLPHGFAIVLLTVAPACADPRDGAAWRSGPGPSRTRRCAP